MERRNGEGGGRGEEGGEEGWEEGRGEEETGRRGWKTLPTGTIQMIYYLLQEI